MDSSLYLTPRIQSIIKYRLHLQRTFQICPLLYTTTVTTLIQAPSTSPLGCYGNLLIALPSTSTPIQSFLSLLAARVILCKLRSRHLLIRTASNLYHIWHKIQSSLYMVHMASHYLATCPSNRNSYHFSLPISLKCLARFCHSVSVLAFSSAQKPCSQIFPMAHTCFVQVWPPQKALFLTTLSKILSLSFSPYPTLITT